MADFAAPSTGNDKPFRGHESPSEIAGSLVVNGNVGIGTTLPSLRLYNSSSDATIIMTPDDTSRFYNTYTSGGPLMMNDFITATPDTFTASLRINNQTSYYCPIHGPIGAHVMSFDLPGVNETYCIMCMRDLLRKSLIPLNEGGGMIEKSPGESGVSRYEIAKQSETKEKI